MKKNKNKAKIKIKFGGKADMHIKSNAVTLGQLMDAAKGLQEVIEQETGLPYSIVEMKYDQDHSN